MGSTSPQQSQATIPSQMYPFLKQGQEYIGAVNSSMPNYSNFLNSPTGASAMGLGKSVFAPGGAAQQAQGAYGNIISGNFLNPASNPFLQGVMDQSQSNFQRTLGSGLDQLSSYMNMHGQGPQSGSFGNAATNLTRTATQDYGNQMNQMLFGNYQQGMGQLLQALGMGNPALSMASSAMPLADLPNTLAMQQMQAASMPAQLYNQFLSGIPLGQTSYGQSPFAQNFGMGMQGAQGLAQIGMLLAMMG